MEFSEKLCSEKCGSSESGWTDYIASYTSEGSGDSRAEMIYKGKEGMNGPKSDEESDDDDDDSLASDASSGPIQNLTATRAEEEEGEESPVMDPLNHDDGNKNGGIKSTRNAEKRRGDTMEVTSKCLKPMEEGHQIQF